MFGFGKHPEDRSPRDKDTFIKLIQGKITANQYCRTVEKRVERAMTLDHRRRSVLLRRKQMARLRRALCLS